PGLVTMAVMRYVPLFTCGMLVYAVARRAIGDPRLQALAVFSLSLLWVIGYQSHRILTHSNIMVVAIAGTVLTVLILRERPTAARYWILGLWLAIGTFAKFGFPAFVIALFCAMASDREFRPVLLDRRIILSLSTAML